MNAAFYYNSHRKSINFDDYSSKTGTRVAVFPSREKDRSMNAEDKSALDTVLAFFCSAEFIFVAKIVFGLLAISGFLSMLCGSKAGAISLVMGCICLTLVILLEYVNESEKNSL